MAQGYSAEASGKSTPANYVSLKPDYVRTHVRAGCFFVRPVSASVLTDSGLKTPTFGYTDGTTN
jgi:hypothetical protein